MTRETRAYVAVAGERRRPEVYVGIGKTHARAFSSSHTARANEILRSAHTTLGTARPFSTPEDAELAESLLIRTLAEIGVKVGNRAKVATSSDIAPILQRKAGVVRYAELRNTLVVMVTPDKLLDRGISRPAGVVNHPRALAARCDRYWPLDAAARRGVQVEYLVAVLKGVYGHPIVGRWRTQPIETWDLESKTVRLDRPDRWNVGGWRGYSLDWCGRHPQRMQWSDDIA